MISYWITQGLEKSYWRNYINKSITWRIDEYNEGHIFYATPYYSLITPTSNELFANCVISLSFYAPYNKETYNTK